MDNFNRIANAERPRLDDNNPTKKDSYRGLYERPNTAGKAASWQGWHKPGGLGAIRGELKFWVDPPSGSARIQSGSVELFGISISKRLKKYLADQ